MEPTRFDRLTRSVADHSLTRRSALLGGSALTASVIALQGRAAARAQEATPAATPVSQSDAIVAICQTVMADEDLRSVIVRVTIDGRELITEAFGESMTGVPATKDMHFRNGAVAISYIAMLLLQLVDEGKVTLDDTLDAWYPDFPTADKVTLRSLITMTSGYPDYVPDDKFQKAFFADPFREFTTQEKLDYAFSSPPHFPPGENWSYAHTNIVILGMVLEKVTGQPMAELMQDRLLTPLALDNTFSLATPEIPEPALHSFSSERRTPLGVPKGARFYEESSFWNPSWTLAQGSIQVTNIYDMTATAEAIGTGTTLSSASHAEMIAPKLLGFGAPLEGCLTCHTLDESYSYGLGVVISGEWILQNPLFGGYGAIEAVLPSDKIAIAVSTTFGEKSFGEDGSYLSSRASWTIFAKIAALLAPDKAPAAERK